MNQLISKIPEGIREDILRYNSKRPYRLKSCNLGSISEGGRITHALSEIIYKNCLNGNKEVKNIRGKCIKITPEGVVALQKALK